jgi:phosphatidylglycerophosphate synthase
MRRREVAGDESAACREAAGEKFAPEDRYFNVSVLWIFYYRRVLRALYRLRVPHEVVTVLSLACGLAAAWLIGHGRFVPGAVLLHFKDVFDACDGALARMTERAHRIGRFMDSVFDFIALTAVVLAIAFGTRQEAAARESLLLGAVAALSLFLQCSYFNYQQLRYMETLEDRRLTSAVDEAMESVHDQKITGAARRGLLAALRGVYLVAFGWQDRLMQAIDDASRRLAGTPADAVAREWYGSKRFMTLASALCFGTHIGIMVVALLARHPRWALYVIVVPMNLYWGSLMLVRIVSARRQRR